ncbi:cytidine deaminase [bacterium]|nr:cytidine deaminase [bacterium]
MDNQKLISKAVEARKKAFAPYSKFQVGAAILTETGEIFTGSNVECSSYGLTVCAERVALTKAVSEGFTKFTKIAVVADTKKPCSPCGACRQFLNDFGGDLEVIMVNLKSDAKVKKISELLPDAFEDKDLSR